MPDAVGAASGPTQGGTLIVCRTLGGLESLPTLAHPDRCRIASDDPRVHAAAARRGIVDAVHIEESASLFTVADEVRAILRALNQWLADAPDPDGVPAPLLYWASHAEGGDTTQRIQDGVLLARSYLAVLDAQHPAEVILVQDTTPSWENELFAECARARGVSVRTVGGTDLRSRGRALWARWRPLAKEAVYSSRVVAAWFRGTTRRVRITDDRAVVIQLCDPATKHVNTVEPLLNALGAVGLQGVVAGWSAAPAIQALASRGHAAFELEGWVPFGALPGSWWRTVRSWRAARRREDRFLRDDALTPYATLLRPILWHSMRAFFLGEVAHRSRLDVACRRFFAVHRPRAARLWTRVLPQAVTAYRALPTTGGQPLLFWQPGWPYNVPEPLRDYPVRADLIFALSGAHRDLLLSEGVRPEQVEVAGLPWLEMVRTFGATHSKADSRALLGVPVDARAVVLYDAGTVFRGYLSPSEQEVQLRALLECARRLEGLQLIIKPHPTHRAGALEATIAEFGLANVHYVKPTGPVYHALNAADLLITKISTLAIEGMCLEVPTVAVLFGREPGFMLYEDAVDYAFDAGELTAAVERLVREPGREAAWRQALLRRSAAYIERHALNMTGNPNAQIAGVLRDRLTPGS